MEHTYKYLYFIFLFNFFTVINRLMKEVAKKSLPWNQISVNFSSQQSSEAERSLSGFYH